MLSQIAVFSYIFLYIGNIFSFEISGIKLGKDSSESVSYCAGLVVFGFAAAILSILIYRCYQQAAETKKFLKQLKNIPDELFSKEDLDLNNKNAHEYNRKYLQAVAALLVCTGNSIRNSNQGTSSLSLFSILMKEANLIFKKLRNLSKNHKTKVIFYKGYGEAEEIKDKVRYQLALVAYNAGKQTKSAAQVHYICLMFHLLTKTKTPRAALFLEQFLLRLVGEDLLSDICKKPKLFPQEPEEGKTNDDDGIQPDEKTDNRKVGDYLKDLPEERVIDDIRSSLLSGHGTIYVDNFYKRNGTGIPCFNIQTGWLDQDNKSSMTYSEKFNRHKQLPGSSYFGGRFEELEEKVNLDHIKLS